MLRLLVAASLLAVSPFAASAEEMTVVIANSHPYAVQLEMYSQDRNHAWPGGGEVYILDDGETKNIALSCDDGENICYGAWVSGDASTFWGVGVDNSKECSDCCYVCDGGSTENINLVE